MTREQLNISIDTVFDNNRADDSLTPEMGGAKLKEVADYIEQEIVAKTKKVTITHAELLLLNTTPKEILPAVAGIAYLPIHFLFKYNNNSGWGNSGTPWTLSLGNTSLGSFNMQIGGGELTEQINLGTGGNSSVSDSYFNKAITLSANSNLSSPSNVSATCDVYITYYEIKL